jgi:predicted NBD/HSP70 family sugar kinase
MYISIDAGGTNTRVAATAELANPVFLAEPWRRKNTHNFENDMGFIIDTALNLADGEQIEAAGIGTPGYTNQDKTQISFAANLAGWANKPLVKSLSDGLNCPVFYDGDIVAAGLGEAYYGQREGDFDYLIWGTGICGSTVRYNDSKPDASIVDWFTYFEDWEADCGGGALGRVFGKPPEELVMSDWKIIADKFQGHLSEYLAIFKPAALVFGGSLAIRHAEMLKNAGQNLGTHVEVTKFGDDFGLMGGFGLIKQALTP